MIIGNLFFFYIQPICFIDTTDSYIIFNIKTKRTMITQRVVLKDVIEKMLEKCHCFWKTVYLD